MPKLTQAEIKSQADEWAKYQKQLDRLSEAYDADLQPLLDRQSAEAEKLTAKHAAELEPIAKKHEPKIDKLQDKADKIEETVCGWLEANGKPISLKGALAEAGYTIGSKIGVRVVDKTKLLALCKKKGVEIWECVEVIIKKAEPLLGKKEIDAISTKPEVETRSAYLRLND